MKKSKQHRTRVRNLVVALTLTAIMLSVSTFAWFIGMRTVGVTSFDVEIAVTEDLRLSLNGVKWFDDKEPLIINGDNFNDDDVVYEGHTNWWTGGKGLIPMSTIGEIDPGSSRLMLYEKLSLTASDGGYRLMSSRVENTANWDDEETGFPDRGHPEAPGYVAFDLFIENSSGSDYISNYNPDDEEAIYLTVDSAVGVAQSGGVAGTGIENSVRVAFAQIGRVKKGTAADTITGINCQSGEESGVTPICERPATIWEPNDTDHVVGAISWYNTSCLGRDAEGTFNTESCNEVLDGTYYPTYAVARPISSSDKVDVYDGTIYNGYGGRTKLPAADIYNGFPNETKLDPEADEDVLLYAVPTFTDSMKVQTGTARRPFLYLAANSVTKVRVYIYIEGQDIDNYDFASIGKRISVTFGFTKQRFEPSDIPGYDEHPSTEPTTP